MPIFAPQTVRGGYKDGEARRRFRLDPSPSLVTLQSLAERLPATWRIPFSDVARVRYDRLVAPIDLDQRVVAERLRHP